MFFKVYCCTVDKRLGVVPVTEIWLLEKYYKEFHQRKGNYFSDTEAIDVYQQTQLLQQRWPQCIGNPPPEIGAKFGLFYTKHDWPTCRFRICFGAYKDNGVDKIIALTCRTKQEISKGSSNGTAEWYRHMSLGGVARWDDYRRGQLKAWKIYP